MECVCFTLIVDDIVLPHGEAVMEVLGGGGPQTLFGYQLVANRTAVVGLSAGVGPDLPKRCKDWLEGLGVDTSGLVPYQRPTPRAWQVFEEWGRRTQIWRGRDDPCDELYEMLRPKYDTMPARFQRSANYHLGIHPLHPPRRLMQQLRRAAHAHGGALSIEPYTAAEEPATPEQVATLLAHCDIFSPNEAEAESMVGPGSPEDLARRLLALSPRGGADIVVIRCGPEGVLIARRQLQPQPQPHTSSPASRPQAGNPAATEGANQDVHVEAYRVPAVADTAVVDVTGCGNAFCGGFLAALYRGRGVGVSPHGIRSPSGVSEDSGAPRSGTRAGAQVISEAPEGSDPDATGRDPQRPAWLRTGDLRLAGSWGCVAASFMAEERGVPLRPVAALQDKAMSRMDALLSRIHPVRPGQPLSRKTACNVAALLLRNNMALPVARCTTLIARAVVRSRASSFAVSYRTFCV